MSVADITNTKRGSGGDGMAVVPPPAYSPSSNRDSGGGGDPLLRSQRAGTLDPLLRSARGGGLDPLLRSQRGGGGDPLLRSQRNTSTLDLLHSLETDKIAAAAARAQARPKRTPSMMQQQLAKLRGRGRTLQPQLPHDWEPSAPLHPHSPPPAPPAPAVAAAKTPSPPVSPRAAHSVDPNSDHPLAHIPLEVQAYDGRVTITALNLLPLSPLVGVRNVQHPDQSVPCVPPPRHARRKRWGAIGSVLQSCFSTYTPMDTYVRVTLLPSGIGQATEIVFDSRINVTWPMPQRLRLFFDPLAPVDNYEQTKAENQTLARAASNQILKQQKSNDSRYDGNDESDESDDDEEDAPAKTVVQNPRTSDDLVHPIAPTGCTKDGVAAAQELARPSTPSLHAIAEGTDTSPLFVSRVGVPTSPLSSVMMHTPVFSPSTPIATRPTPTMAPSQADVLSPVPVRPVTVTVVSNQATAVTGPSGATQTTTSSAAPASTAASAVTAASTGATTAATAPASAAQSTASSSTNANASPTAAAGTRPGPAIRIISMRSPRAITIATRTPVAAQQTPAAQPAAAASLPPPPPAPPAQPAPVVSDRPSFFVPSATASMMQMTTPRDHGGVGEPSQASSAARDEKNLRSMGDSYSPLTKPMLSDAHATPETEMARSKGAHLALSVDADDDAGAASSSRPASRGKHAHFGGSAVSSTKSSKHREHGQGHGGHGHGHGQAHGHEPKKKNAFQRMPTRLPAHILAQHAGPVVRPLLLVEVICCAPGSSEKKTAGEGNAPQSHPTFVDPSDEESQLGSAAYLDTGFHECESDRLVSSATLDLSSFLLTPNTPARASLNLTDVETLDEQGQANIVVEFRANPRIDEEGVAHPASPSGTPQVRAATRTAPGHVSEEELVAVAVTKNPVVSVASSGVGSSSTTGGAATTAIEIHKGAGYFHVEVVALLGLRDPFNEAVMHEQADWALMRKMVLAVLLYLAAGVAFYMRYEDWTLLEAVYFCVVTATTAGYGDLIPTSDNSRIFTMFFVLVGIGMIAIAVAIAGGLMLERQEQEIYRAMMAEKTKAASGKDPAASRPQGDRWFGHTTKRLLMSFVIFNCVLWGGTIGFMEFEGLRFLEAVYLCIVTLSTVGYGDVAPRSVSGRAFCIPWIVLSALAVTRIVGDITNVYMTWTRSNRAKHVLKNSVQCQTQKHKGRAKRSQI